LPRITPGISQQVASARLATSAARRVIGVPLT
jgi:hypothetical protein